MHPAIAFGCAIAGASIAGIVGAFLALPIAAIVQAIGSTVVERHAVVESDLTRDAEDAQEAFEQERARDGGRPPKVMDRLRARMNKDDDEPDAETLARRGGVAVEGRGGSGGVGSADAAAVPSGPAGRNTLKEAPPPGRSSTQARPPWSCANRPTNDRPIPVPGECEDTEGPWRNGSKIASRRCSVDARPVVLDA